MNKIWESLASSSSQNELTSINKLIEDDSTKFLTVRSLAQRFLTKDDIFIADPLEQIMLMVSAAPFLKSENECVQITHIVEWAIKETNIFPMISEHQNQDLAYRCLISLSFFHSMMEKRTKTRGTPSPDFYERIGIRTFEKIGYDEVSADFVKWEGYLGEITV